MKSTNIYANCTHLIVLSDAAEVAGKQAPEEVHELKKSRNPLSVIVVATFSFHNCVLACASDSIANI